MALVIGRQPGEFLHLLEQFLVQRLIGLAHQIIYRHI